MWIQKKLADRDPTVYHHATYVMFLGLVDMIVTCFHMQKIASDDKRRKNGKDQESIQSSSTPDQRRHDMGKRQKHKETSHTTDNSNLILEKNY